MAMRRAARLGDGWQPIGTNASFPMATPEQVRVGINRLDGYVERAGRPPGSVEVTCRMHGYELSDKGARPQGQRGNFRGNFQGTAEQVASDIRLYEEMGVKNLIGSFGPVATVAGSRDDMLRDMERLANEVRPLV